MIGELVDLIKVQAFKPKVGQNRSLPYESGEVWNFVSKIRSPRVFT